MSRRLLAGYLSLALVVLAALEIPLGVTYARNERSDLTGKVEHDATAVASLAEGTLEHGGGLGRLARLATVYLSDTGGRIVIVDRRGRAIADSAPIPGESRDFRSRPEITQALEGQTASGTRYSETLQKRLLYVAVPVASSGTVLGAVRITYPTSTVDARVRRYWLSLAAIAAIVLALAAAVGVVLARSTTRPLREVEAAAEAAGAGDLEARAPVGAGPPEVRALAATFNDMVARLDQLVASQREFVADASHQLRTPLTALRLRLENLEAGRDGVNRREVDGALAEVERLSRLVDGLLALARADAGAEPAVAVDVRATIVERLDAWRAFAAERRIELEPAVEGEPRARAAPDRIEQVLDNLLANAIDASPDGSAIEVSARGDGEWVELRVRDEGPGMTAEERERAFDRFWSRRSDGGGSGLGLAIVRRLVVSDGGAVELRAAPGRGVEAVVRLRPATAV
jgi:signal transduction histidine kinase